MSLAKQLQPGNKPVFKPISDGDRDDPDGSQDDGTERTQNNQFDVDLPQNQ